MNQAEGLAPPVHLRWIALGSALLVQISISIIVIGMPALVPFIQADLNLSHGQVGTFVSALNVGTMCALPFAGMAVDRLGERFVLTVGGVATGLLAMSLLLPRGFWLPLLVLALVGVAAATPTPAGSKAVMSWFPLRQRATAMGIRQTGIPLGGALAALILPPLAIAWGWRYSLVLAGGIAILAAGIAFTSYRAAEGPDPVPGQPPARAGIGAMREVMTRSVLFVSLSGLVLGLAQFCLLTYLVLYLRDRWGIAVAVGEGLLLAANLGGGFGRIFWGMVSDRLFGGSRRNALMLVTLLAAALSLALALLPARAPLPLLAAVALLFGSTGLGWNGLYITLVSELSRPGRHGATLGNSMLITYIGIVGAPPLFGLLVDRSHSYQLAWQLLAAVLLLSGLLLLPVREPAKEGFRRG